MNLEAPPQAPGSLLELAGVFITAAAGVLMAWFGTSKTSKPPISSGPDGEEPTSPSPEIAGDLAESVSSLAGTVRALQDDNSRLRKDVNALRADRDSDKGRIESLEKAVDQRDKRIEDIERFVDEQDKHITDIEAGVISGAYPPFPERPVGRRAVDILP